MNPAQLLSHFDRISEAPDAIPRLRRFILDLAVRGKLVEQDLRDEPASELLKRIQSEKARLVKVGKIKEPQPLAAINKATVPYEIPRSWEWIPLGETINSHLGGGTPSKNNSAYWDGDIFWASVKDVGKGKYVDETIDRITKAGLADSSSNLIPPGNLIIVTRMGLGKVSINRVPIAINQDLRALSLSSLSEIDYHYNFFKTHGFEGTGLTVKGIKVEELLNIAFPLPPLAEQHRIVAKVDELMALCDRLEAAQAEREIRRDRLVASSLNRLNQPADDQSIFQDHARFYFNHLPRLTTNPEHIQQLRQTILNLAVRGKLVPQDPNDEPASELLSRIKNRRAKLLEQGYPNESEATTQLRKQQKQFVSEGMQQLPLGWQWTTLMQCSALVVDCHNKTAPYSSNGIILLRTTNVRNGMLNLNEPKFVDEKTYARWSARCQPEPGDILITREAPMGEVCIIPEGMRICLGQRMMLARLVPKTIDPRFILYSLRDPNLMDRVQDKPVGATVQHLRVGGVETLLVPLPPLAEQHRIVAKVDELMALCDKLDAQLTTTQTESRRLLEAVLHVALSQEPTTATSRPTHTSLEMVGARTSSASTGRPNKHFARTLLAAEIIHQLHAEPTFGRTKHQKILYLCEHIARIEEVSGEYYRQAAGPLDNRLIYSVEAELKKQRWYEEYRRPQYGHGYRPLEKAGGHLKYLERYWPDKLSAVRRLINIMRTWDTDHCEMFATAYAAWNDLLIWKREPTDKAILDEILGRWHERKKRFSETQWRAVIAWIRKEGCIPVGFGRLTKQLANP